MISLSGQTALIAQTGPDWLGPAQAALEAAGAVVRTCRDERLAGPPEAVREALDEALAGATPTLVMLSLLTPRSMIVRDLVETDLEAWREAAVEPVRIAMRVLSVLGERMKPSGQGAIVLIAPSLSLVGAPGLTGLTSALEGQRGLVKSVARQWGASGVRVNWAVAAPVALDTAFGAMPLATKGDAVPVALPERPGVADTIADLAIFLASPGGRGLTGATLMCDGGEWMTP